jgi:putative transposase
MTTTHRREERLDGKLSRAVLKAGRREQSLLPSHHVRYIEHHQIPGITGSFYTISILDNFSRAVLASDIFQRQDLTAYLLILYAAIQQHGSPETLVSDSGGIFKAKQAQVIYHALEITKEQIHRKQAWENLIETQLSAETAC